MQEQSAKTVIIVIVLSVFSVLCAETDTVSVIGVGDLMLGTSFPDRSALPMYPERLLKQVDDILRSADLSVANLEGCLMDSGGTPKDSWGKTERSFIFRMPESYVHHILDAGFDAVGLANNHMRDMGYQSYRRTMEVCDSTGLRHAGIYSAPADTFTINGIRFGFAAFSPHWATARMHDYDKVTKIISELDEHSDIVVAMFHGGGEGEEYAHTPRVNENYKGSIRGNAYRFAHTAVDAGADIVFGSGPHVTRAVELYRDRLIAYSLGNFCTYRRFNLQGSRGVAPILKVFTGRDGAFLYARVFSILQHYPGYPAPDNEQRALKEMRALTMEDFPEMDSVLVIDDSGYIYKR
ncbi:MAG: CapA family protein [Candidatus Marinimicrobia bacterium]|nr:CapA family protein [Candidatus Neomarinimicrobiota bacterium]